MMNTLNSLYLIGIIASFSYWLNKFWKDTSVEKNNITSWQILMTLSIIWPFSLAIIILNHQENSDIQDIHKEHQQGEKLLLGQILQEAGLISTEQINVALKIQNNTPEKLKIGQVMVQKGWLKPETIEFFAEDLPKLNNSLQKEPIGFYLKKSQLLNDEQINSILAEQKEVSLRFGEIAAEKKWLKLETVEYILQHLNFKSNTQQNLSYVGM